MKILAKVVLIAFLWITVIQGNFGNLNGDTNVRLHMAHAWWTGTEEVQLPPEHQATDRQGINFIANGVRGVNGKRYVTYDVGQPMLMLPGDWVGSQLQQWLPFIPAEFLRHLSVAFLIFVPLNVAAVAACFWLLRLFDFNQRLAGLASISWANLIHAMTRSFNFHALKYMTHLPTVRSAACLPNRSKLRGMRSLF